MNFNNIKYDWDDIAIIPTSISNVESRESINIYTNLAKLPIFVAPMDTVLDDSNIETFLECNLNLCLPRGIKFNPKHSFKDRVFYSYGLSEIEEIIYSNDTLPNNVLIDIANGHMNKLFEVSKKLKEKYPYIKLMIGNIANPETYKHILLNNIADYVRVGIGTGQVCTTSANTGVNYPLASLVNECRDMANLIKEICSKSNTEYKHVAIIADGGFKNYSDIIKAIGHGADYVMLGSIFNKCVESCVDKYDDSGKLLSNDDVIRKLVCGESIYGLYRGMSTKAVQKSWNKDKLKTSEGISKKNKIEYTLKGWCENFSDYLKSAMSYSGVFELDKFIGKAKFIFISNNAHRRFNK